MMSRDAKTASLFEQRVFDPDIAKSRPGEPETSYGARLSNWFWDKLSYFL